MTVLMACVLTAEMHTRGLRHIWPFEPYAPGIAAVEVVGRRNRRAEARCAVEVA